MRQELYHPELHAGATRSSGWARRAESRWSTRVLRTVLLGRVVWNAAFALYLLQMRDESVAHLVEAFLRFATVDGLLALLMAAGYLVVTPRRSLWLSPATDAATRAALVLIAGMGPGILQFPLTAVLYLSLIATFVFGDGALDLAEGISLDRELGRGSGWLTLVASGSISMVVGLILFAATTDPALLLVLLVVMSAVHAAAFASAVRHVPLMLAEPGAARVSEETPES